MAAYVLARDVRDELLVAVWSGVQNEESFSSDRSDAERLGSNIEAQFERYIEPRQTVGRSEFDAGQIVNPEPAAADDPLDLR